MSLINKDFRTHNTESDKRWYTKLRWPLLALVSIGMGVVIANTRPFQQTVKTALSSLANSKPDTVNGTISITIPINNTDKNKATTNLPPSADKTPSGDRQINSSKSAISTSDKKLQNREQFSLTLPALPAQPQTQPVLAPQSKLNRSDETTSQPWQTFKIKSGDSLARIFKRAGFKAVQVHALMQSGTAVKKLRKIHPGDIIRIQTDSHGRLLALRYDINKIAYLNVERKNNTLTATIAHHNIDTRTTHASGKIESSLYLAAKKASISQNLIMKMAGIFGWDIDFAQDIRKGDQFTLVYQQLYRNGEKISDGNILAAEFINRGKTYRAVRYTNPQTNHSEYYTPDGKSMRKAFLRTPVKYTRISSRFSLRRYHPILHKFRSHKGVDYAAKIGTPVYAAGDGKVIFKGRKGGYGRVIILKHGPKYSTLYGHLHRFNRHIKVGSRVRQGQTIAYVGMSGLATGPHLHYEFRVYGVHRNPLTVKLPEAKPIPKRYLADFELMTTPMLAQLDAIARHQQLAYADTKKQ